MKHVFRSLPIVVVAGLLLGNGCKEKTTPATHKPTDTEIVASPFPPEHSAESGLFPVRDPLENIPEPETSSPFALPTISHEPTFTPPPVTPNLGAPNLAEPLTPFPTAAPTLPDSEAWNTSSSFTSPPIPEAPVSDAVAPVSQEPADAEPTESPSVPDEPSAPVAVVPPINPNPPASDKPTSDHAPAGAPEAVAPSEPATKAPDPASAPVGAFEAPPVPEPEAPAAPLPPEGKPSSGEAGFTTPSLFTQPPATKDAPAPETRTPDESPGEGQPSAWTDPGTTAPVDEVKTPETATGLAADSDRTSKYDPIAVNGEFFVDWPEPKLLLVFTGFMNGYVEPCGCAGLEQMKGGLSRRHTFIKELEAKGWPVLPIDAGNLNKGFGRQEELKYNFVIDESLRLMKYGAAGIGNRELLLPTDTLINYTVDVPGNPKRYTSANVAILEFNPDFVKPYRVLEKNGLKIGVVSVVCPSFLKEINNQEIVHENSIDKLRAVLPELDVNRCDRRVLIAHGTTAEIDRILKAFPGRFDFVMGSDTPAEPPPRPNRVDGAMLVEVGEKGKFAVAVGLYDDPATPVRYQRVALDSRYANSSSVVAMMRLYQDQLRQMGLAGLGIKPIPDRRTAENGKYVGSKACADCHEPSYAVWRKSRHAAAWRSLAEISNPPRTHDPECIACHVVGWNPVEFLPYENGFLGEKETPLLTDVGCESCHGPGEHHAQAELGSDTALQERLRAAVRLPLAGNAARKACIECHDGDNSPHFDFDVYWPKIVHPESEE